MHAMERLPTKGLLLWAGHREWLKNLSGNALHMLRVTRGTNLQATDWSVVTPSTKRCGFNQPLMRGCRGDVEGVGIAHLMLLTWHGRAFLRSLAP